MRRDLPARLVCRALIHLGIGAEIDGDYLTVRREPGRPVLFKLWLRKGASEMLRSATLLTLCGHLLDIPTETFRHAVAQALKEDAD